MFETNIIYDFKIRVRDLCQRMIDQDNVPDIDQTDLHRFEPSSCTLLSDEQTDQ